MWSGALRAAVILAKASRWRKLSECKSLVKQVEMHLSIQKKRTGAIARQARVDIAQLLQNGQLLQALARVEKLHKDQSLLAAYDQIAHFCNCITTNIALVCQNKDVKDLGLDVGEAVASLIFAASRCGEMPELHLLRGLFKEKFGSGFDIINVELQPGNLVNSQLKEKLCISVIPDEVKQDLLSEILKEGNVQLVLQYSPAVARQNYSFADKDFKPEQKDGKQIQVPKFETESESAGIVCSLSKGKFSVATPSRYQMDSNGTDGLLSSTKTKRNGAQDHTSNENMQIRRGHLSPPRDSGHKDGRSMLDRRRHSLNALVDEHKLANGSSPCSSHVHPKLPDYDDLVAKLRRVKAENRRQKSFSFF